MNNHVLSSIYRLFLAFGFISICQAAPFNIVDAESFESPSYVVGSLNGQLASTDGGTNSVAWKQTIGGSSTAAVQNTVVFSGTQAVEVNRTANSDSRWAAPVTGYPNQQFVVIDWNMRVEQTTGATYGPFFGVEAYDATSSFLRIGGLGVDATTGELLYFDRTSGLVPVTGFQANFGSWNHFQIQLDFINGTYSGLLNGELAFTTDFEFAGVTAFTDADLTAIAASGDASSLAATGTAYFDNFKIDETSNSLVAGQDSWGNTPFLSTGSGWAFQFTDISSTGTALPITLGSVDDGSALVNPSHPFPVLWSGSLPTPGEYQWLHLHRCQ